MRALSGMVVTLRSAAALAPHLRRLRQHKAQSFFMPFLISENVSWTLPEGTWHRHTVDILWTYHGGGGGAVSFLDSWTLLSSCFHP